MKVRFAILLTATVWLSACGEKYSPDVTAGVAATPSQSAVGSTSIAQNSGVSLTAADESSPFTFRCTAWKQRFADTLASFRGPRAMATDGSNLYVVDAEGRTIRKVEIATGQVSTLAGSGLEGAMDGMGASASFAGIRGLATDGKFLYAGDVVNQKIRKIDLATRQVTTLPISVKPVAEDGVGVTGVNFGGILAVVGNNLYATYGFTVRKVDLATGQVSLFVGHTDNNSPAKDGVGSAATFPGGISHMVTDGENLYVAGKGKENVRKIEIPNQRVTSITHGGLNYPSALTVSGPYLYATDSHSIVKIEISTGQVITLAEKDGHSPQSLADSIGSVYPSGEVAGQDRDGGTLISRVHGIGAIYPSGMVAVGDKLYVSYSNIGMIDLATRAVFPVAGSGFTGTTDGAGAAYYPLDTTIAASDDNLYLWGNADDILFKLDFTTGEISGVAGSDASGAKDGIGAFATFNYPRGMTIIENVMYVSDYSNHLIRKIILSTGEVATLAGSGKQGKSDGVGIAASFNFPRSITSDGIHLYVADYDNHSIRKIEIATGKVTTLAGSGKQGSKDGTGVAASFKNPRGIAINGGSLYVADTYNHKIRKIDIASGKVTTLAGSGNEGVADDTGKAASFSYPQSIAVNDGNLYVADYGNNAIRKIVISTGVVTTLAGSGKAGAKDGTGAGASFNLPEGIATNGKNLYVTDSGYHTVRKIEIDTGTVMTLVAGQCSSVPKPSGPVQQ